MLMAVGNTEGFRAEVGWEETGMRSSYQDDLCLLNTYWCGWEGHGGHQP